jgi:hypothetical protein
MIALAEGRKHPAGSGRGAFRWGQLSSLVAASNRAGDVRRFGSRGVREGNHPLAAWQGEVPTPSWGRDSQCLLVVALRLDLDVVGWVVADHKLFHF